MDLPRKSPKSAVSRLRELLADKDNIIVCPGVYDGLSARIALREDFECLYMTGAGTAISRLGMADLGVTTLNDMRDNASMIAGLDPGVPLIADADTGYGGPIMVSRTVSQYMQSGIAALHLEDQVITKRCGHLRNKELVPEDEYLTRIRAAVKTRASTPGDIVIIARTDALESLGYDAAVHRLKRAVEIGADVAFLEGIASHDQARRVCLDLAPTPVLFNAVPGGVSPDFSVEEARDIGFRVIIFPGLALKAAYEGITGATRALKEGRSQSQMDGRGAGIKDIFEVCGLKEAVQFDIDAGGSMYSKGV